MKKNKESNITIFLIIILLFFLILFFISINNYKNNLENNINIYNKENKNVTPNSSYNNINKTYINEIEIANFESNIYDNDKNRIDNITLATQKLNNQIIKSNTIFSFNDTIGPITKENGFKKATGFDSKGKNIKVYGGGLCQISSTLYNAALLANLEIVERHPHSKRVYYVPKDKDATIAYGIFDLKFKNNKKNDIKIIITNNSSNVNIKLIELEQTN